MNFTLKVPVKETGQTTASIIIVVPLKVLNCTHQPVLDIDPDIVELH